MTLPGESSCERCGKPHPEGLRARLCGRCSAAVQAGENDSLEVVLVAPIGEQVLMRIEVRRPIRLHPADARELARQLVRCAEAIDG